MAKSNIPLDVQRELEDADFKFDENGEIIEGSFSENTIPDDEDDNEADDQDDSSNDDQDDDQDDSQDDDQDDDDDEPPVRSKSKVISLTPRQEEKDDEEVVNSASLKKMQEDMLKRIDELAKKTPGTSSTNLEEDDDDSAGVAELKVEARKFQQMRIQMFAKEVERDVNSLALGATFKDMIASEEWRQYLNSRMLGTTIGTLYVDSVKENDSDAVVGFFSDFTGRYLPSVASSKKVSKTVKEAVAVATSKEKPSLDNLSVPDRSKAAKAPLKSSRYDYEEADYQKMLDKAERGRITFEDFTKFDTKFNASLSKGRVKKSS